MKRIVAVLVLLLAAGVFVFSANVAEGGGGLTGGATEFTQIMNNSELIEAIRKASEQIHNQITQITNQITQITNQITMIQDMILNTLNLPSQIFGEIMKTINKVKAVYEKTKGIIFSMGQIDQVIRQKFQSYSDYAYSDKTQAAFEEDYKQISNTRQETIINAMESLKVKYDQYTSDAELLTQLQQKAESATGRNQILQTANQLNSFASQQLMEIREMAMLQTNIIATVAEAERAERDLERAKLIESRQIRETPKYGTYYLGDFE